MSEEKEDLISGHIEELDYIRKDGYLEGVRKVRNALFWAAAIILFNYLLALFRSDEFNWALIAEGLFVSGIFLVLGIYTRKKPYTATIFGIVVFVLWWAYLVLINVVYEGGEPFQAIFGSILFKIVLIVILARNLNAAKELQKMDQEEAGHL